MRRFTVVLFVLSFCLVPAAFAENQPPVAQPQTVFTQERIEITLRGSDPEGRDLRFEIVEIPRFGEVTEPQPIIPEPETDPRTGEPIQPPVTSAVVVYTPSELVPDAFTFAVIDDQGASGTAVVAINPPSEEPPPPVETITADDTAADVLMNSESALLTLTGSAPERVVLRFAILAPPSRGQLGELVQTGDRIATVPYTPERGFVGEDAFEFEVCGELGGQQVCDAGLYRINVIERTQEEIRLAGDIHATTTINQPVSISLATDNRAPVQGPTLVERAVVAGQVFEGGAEVPVLMNANERAHMQIEFDMRMLLELSPRITRADVVLQTHRSAVEGAPAQFHWFGNEADGELDPSDFFAEVERIPGAVMPIPPLEQMPVGADGTFAFDVLGELQTALESGFRFFALQGRAPFDSLDVRTTAPENLERELEPRLIIETVLPPEPLAYTIRSLPESGTLKDGLGNEIREVPYRLPNSVVVYTPALNATGQVTWAYEATDGFLVDSAHVYVVTLLAACQWDRDWCWNGR